MRDPWTGWQPGPRFVGGAASSHGPGPRGALGAVCEECPEPPECPLPQAAASRNESRPDSANARRPFPGATHLMRCPAASWGLLQS